MIYAFIDFKLEEQYFAQGCISSASFRHAGEDKSFGFEYLAGTHLRSRLNVSNGMNVRHLYEAICRCVSGLGIGKRIYYYTVVKGIEDRVNVHLVKCSIWDTKVMIWHTHPFVRDEKGNNKCDSENFSDAGKWQSYLVYLFTPKGDSKIHYPKNNS